MKTHENRALFSKALLKATTCLFLTAGVGMSPVFALPEASTSVMETVQQNQTISGRITDTSGERPTEPLPTLTVSSASMHRPKAP